MLGIASIDMPRKPGEPIPAETMARILGLLDARAPVVQIATETGIAPATIYRFRSARSARPKPVRRSSMSMPFTDAGELAPMVEKLAARGAMLRTSDDPRERARSQLVAELSVGLQNAIVRAGRRAPVRSQPRANNIALGVAA